jgi:Zn-dependent metalloprotease
MRSRANRARTITKLTVIALVWAMIFAAVYFPFSHIEAAAGNQKSLAELSKIYKRLVPDYDLNASRALKNMRQATGEQLAALDNLKAVSGATQLTMRWNDFGGSPDVIYDFASPAYPGTPEEAGRAFLQQNAALFGISNVADLRLVSNKQALGGNLLRFQQTFGGIDVKHGGVGLVMKDNRVVMASGPFFSNANVNTQPTISAEQARQTVDKDLARFQINLPANISKLLEPGLNIFSQQVAAVSNLEPRLGIYPTADGYKLVWKVAKYSSNPFGLFVTEVDAHTGELISRKDFIDFQQSPVHPYTADIYPKYPTLTKELKDQSIISDCEGTPCGQQRVKLRAFDPQNVVSGLNGTLTGTHALVNNALATKQPFAQAALGTWHFRQDNPAGFEARTNEQDQFAEPAEHQDEINAFFFVTYLLEYVDHLHVAGDRQTAGGSEGDFPNDYPNKTIPLPATVHFPNVYLALNVVLRNRVPDPQDPNLAFKAIGMDNAFAANVTGIYQIVMGTPAPEGVVNPTQYGHGFLMNDLALEGTVPYHEGMHAITSPIAGLEGDVEAGALNEGQADMWAFTITDTPALGEYVIQSKGFRDRARSRNEDPDMIAYIRTARSTLKYSDIGTLFWPAEPELVPFVLPAKPDRYDFESHYDGEIYMSTMWDIREMLGRVYPNDSIYKRPAPKDGLPSNKVTKGTEIFERDFLGSMYILGTTAPDTMVKARDAMIVADQMLYPTDSGDFTQPGKHRAIIEQVFAAKELGVNAKEVAGGTATISTQVTPFVGDQATPEVPQNVRLDPASPRSLKVSWDSVQGAVAYQVLKRQIGFENRRQPNGARVFLDGDSSTTGFSHVAYVGGNETSFIDAGRIQEIFAAAGLNSLFDHEYVVRAIGVNQTGQIGVSDLSGAARGVQETHDLTAQMDAAISNVNFSNGVMAFDNKLTNTRGALSSDKTVYGPVKFEITNISNPTVTVKNADQNGNQFVYNQTLALGQTSGAKRIEFNDPAAQMFSFDARITGQVFASTTIGTGRQTGDGTANPPTGPTVYSIFREEKTGNLLAGDVSGVTGEVPAVTYGNPQFQGITWQDVEITTTSDAQYLDAFLSSTSAPDLDFELRTVDGVVLDTSGDFTANERVFASVQPNTRYILRVKGFGNGPCDFRIISEQLLPQGSGNENAGTRTRTDETETGTNIGPIHFVTKTVRFTVNPLTRKVTVQLLK